VLDSAYGRRPRDRERKGTNLETEDGSEVVDEVPSGDLVEKVVSSVLDAEIQKLHQT
jgi:hypothetical protein